MPPRFSLLAAVLGLLLVSPVARAQTPATPHTGFPMGASGNNLGVVTYGKVLIADLDSNNSAREIVVGTNTGRLIVLNHDGTVRTGWGPGGKTLVSEVASSPAAGNLAGDGKLEIVVGSGSAVPGNEEGEVVAFNADGSVLWRFNDLFDETPVDGLPDAVFSTPALGDLDGDGLDDVVFGSFDYRVWALKGTNGTVLPGWPVFVRDTIWSSPALADLDGDGSLEVIIGSDAHAEGPPINTPAGGALWAFRSNGTQHPGFPRFITYAQPGLEVGIQSSPVVGDVTGDGCPEIVVGTGQPSSGGVTIGRLLHVYQRDGTIPPGWPKALVGQVVGSPALGNLDADAALEIVAPVITYLDNPVRPGAGYIFAFNGDGTQVFQIRPKSLAGGDAVTIGEPIIAQVGANNPAILVGSVDFDVTLISKTGTQISEEGPPYDGTKLYYTTGHPVAGPAVANLDFNGTLTLVAASGRIANDADDLGVFAWDVGAVGAQPWPQFRQGPKRTGTAPVTTGCALPPKPLDYYTVQPCRVSDSRLSGNLTYGGPKLIAGEQRTITFHSNASMNCGVPSTARAVAINVTVAEPTLPGYLSLFPGGDGVPTSTTINFGAGQTRSNNAILPLSFDDRGNLTVYVGMAAGGQVHVILDVFGYFQ
jgi:VCBS repeat protein